MDPGDGGERTDKKYQEEEHLNLIPSGNLRSNVSLHSLTINSIVWFV